MLTRKSYKSSTKSFSTGFWRRISWSAICISKSREGNRILRVLLHHSKSSLTGSPLLPGEFSVNTSHLKQETCDFMLSPRLSERERVSTVKSPAILVNCTLFLRTFSRECRTSPTLLGSTRVLHVFDTPKNAVENFGRCDLSTKIMVCIGLGWLYNCSLLPPLFDVWRIVVLMIAERAALRF